ncbi:hypothetical protein KY289_030431 [Solanum tuberosum]|nr:hypothetical protein KY289_030431 [Solanum tuberosum]
MREAASSSQRCSDGQQQLQRLRLGSNSSGEQLAGTRGGETSAFFFSSPPRHLFLSAPPPTTSATTPAPQ